MSYTGKLITARPLTTNQRAAIHPVPGLGFQKPVERLLDNVANIRHSPAAREVSTTQWSQRGALRAPSTGELIDAGHVRSKAYDQTQSVRSRKDKKETRGNPMSEIQQDEPVLAVSQEGPVAIVTLNRPKAMNSISRAMFAELERTFAGFGDDVRAVVLTGAGERAFCAGLDTKEMASGEPLAPAGDGTQGFGHTRFGLAGFDGIVIAAINGVAVAGGLELALCCDIRIASTTARFGDAHAKVGLLPGALLSSLLPHLIGVARAKEISLSSRLIDAATAERWGLVNRLVEPDELLNAAKELAHDIARHDRRIISAYNRLIDDNFGMTYADAIDNEFRASSDWQVGH